MEKLYQRFILQYFKAHHPELSPHARQISSALNSAQSSGTRQLPIMQIDDTLNNGQSEFVIDAKYYGRSLQSGRGDKQSATYTWNADADRDGSVSGLLLYARTIHEEQPDVDVVLQGNRIGIRTLDLNLPWEALRTGLKGLISWLEPLPGQDRIT